MAASVTPNSLMRNDSEGHDQRLTIVLAGTREDWPGGARTLTPRPPSREPNGRTLWFGAELDPAGCWWDTALCSCRA